MKNKRLTLIELMITIMVLGLLVGIALPQFIGVKKEADVAAFKTDINVLQTAFEHMNSKENAYPLGEKIAASGELFDTLLATGDSASELYKVDLDQSKKYHSPLRTPVNETDYFVYSKESGKIYYTKGFEDGKGQILYSMEYIGLSSLMIGSTPLVNGTTIPNAEATTTLTGQVPVTQDVTITVNGAGAETTYTDVVFVNHVRNINAGIKNKTFSANVTLTPGSNQIMIKSGSTQSTFNISLSDVIIKPVAVISMTPEQGLTTKTPITWSTDTSTTAVGRTITATEWEGKQDIYAVEGIYTVRLRVQDSTGVWSDWVEKPITVISMDGVKEIAAGSEYTILLMKDGTVMSFGRNSYGQLGRINNNTVNLIPTLIPDVSGVKSISAGVQHTLLLMENGSVMSFGLNNFGQLGRAQNSTANPTPTLIPGVTGVKSIEAGTFHSIILLENGTVMSFGYNDYGQLGRTGGVISTPTLIPGVSGVKAIKSGQFHTLLLMENGEVMSFGSNQYGQLGRTQYSGVHMANPTPTLIQGVSGVKSIEAGYLHTLLLLENGSVMSFGLNNIGQLGRTQNSGGTLANPTPTLIPGILGVKVIAAGQYHTLFIIENGEVMSFGYNAYGQLGLKKNISTDSPNSTPTLIPGISGVKNIAANWTHSLLLLENGAAMSFGGNGYGELGRTVNTTSHPAPAEIILK